MRSLEAITENIVETSLSLEAAERELLRLAMDCPADIEGMNAARRARAGLIARLDRLTGAGRAPALRAAG